MAVCPVVWRCPGDAAFTGGLQALKPKEGVSDKNGDPGRQMGGFVLAAGEGVEDGGSVVIRRMARSLRSQPDLGGDAHLSAGRCGAAQALTGTVNFPGSNPAC